MSKNILVIAAHADDEVLGCGGTLAKHSEEGDRVGIILMTDGVSSRQFASQAEIKKRSANRSAAFSILGVELVENFSFPDNALDSIPLLEVAQAIEKAAASFGKPDIIYTHWSGDLNIDHQIVSKAVLTAFRPLHGNSQEIYGFEVLSSTGWQSPERTFSPRLYVDIADEIDTKLKACLLYTSPSPRDA